MKTIAIFMISVLWITNQVKSQETVNQSSSINSVIVRKGDVSDGVHLLPADESAFPVNENRLSAEISIQNDTAAVIEIENCSPAISVEPDFLLQYGNYLGTCAPPMTYAVHGRYLTENLVIRDNFNGSAFISLTGQNDYVSVLTLVPVNGIVDATIYVRHCPDFYDNYSFISHSSSGVEVNLLVETDPVAGEAPVSALGQVQAETGSVIRVPVTAINFEYVAEIHYVIEFDPTALSFIDIETYYVWWADATVVEIGPNLSQLIVDVGCPSDVYMSAPDNEIILELQFNYISGNTSLVFGDCSFRNFWYFIPDDEPASEFYFNGSVSSSVKNTSIDLNLEGLYNPEIEKMNEAMGETEPYFPGEVADQVTIRLASASASFSIVFEIDSVEVDQDGHCVFKVPAIYDGNYYLAVSHRNSIETWSATPVSFNDSIVQYDFTASASQAYGNNMKAIVNSYCIYSGDVNQDGNIDKVDQTPVENQASVFASGYLPADVNGDGMVDTWDMTFIDNNSRNFIGKLFPVSDSLPVLTTDSVNNITVYSAVCHGSVLDQGSSQLTARGVCWDTSTEPTLSDSYTVQGGGPGLFENNITGLIPNTLYYIRTYASNNEGTSYGNEVSFFSSVHSPGEGVTDIDNNSYSTVIIGFQEWMAENLNVTRYRNGDSIPNVTDNAAWSNFSTGAFCWYNNDEAVYSIIYGGLYNWHAVTDTRGLCPEGWHVPTDTEWTELITNYLGGAYIASSKLRSTSGWNINGNGNNISGFNGLPAGVRYYHPSLSFSLIGEAAGFWSSTEKNIGTAYYRYLPTYDYIGWHSNWKNNGYSVRCLKD
ncbi:MAG: FISUMP domain-containing protein [Lentimicrobium sp.]